MKGMIGLIATMCLCVGCASTPQGKYNAANEGFISVTNTLVTARSFGLVDDADWADVLPLINEGNEILLAMREVVNAGGDPTEWQVLLDIILTRLALYVQEVE